MWIVSLSSTWLLLHVAKMTAAKESGQLMEIKEDTLKYVVLNLNYSSIKSFEVDVNAIKEWMKKQPHLPEIMDDKVIGNFLILNKGSVERAKAKIDNYYTLRSQLPEIFDGINPNLPHTQHVLNGCYFPLLPKLTTDMYRVHFFKPRNRSELENWNTVYGTRYLINLQEIRLLEDVMFGDIFVLDGTNIPLGFILKLTPMAMYKAVLIYEKIFSSRLKGLYLINWPSFVDKLLLVLKAVLKAKLYNRIRFVKDKDELIQLLGKEVVPKDYGGNEKSLEELQEILVQKFKEYNEHFIKLDHVRVQEQLRPKEIKNENFGLCGNFKKLDFD